MQQKPVVVLLPYDSCSGLELFGLRFARDLLDRGHQAVVAAPDNSLLAKQCSDRNIRRWSFPAARKYEFSSFPAGKRMLEDLQPAAVIAFRTQMIYPIHLARLLTGQHCPFFLFYRIGAGNFYRKDPLHRRLFANLAAVVPNADHVRNKILKYWGIDQAKVVCIKSGVDTEKYRPDSERNRQFRQELGIADSDIIIGSSGRIHPEKGSEILLRGLFGEGGAGAARPDVHLVYIGREYEPGYADHLRQVADQSGVAKRFHILDFRNDVEKVYSAFDIFAFAVTSSETYAYVILEAMASGVMPVVPATGGLVEMFTDGIEGLFFEHRNADSLRSALSKVLLMSPDKRQQMKLAARQKILSTASWRMMMNHYDHLFHKCRVPGF